MPRREFFRSDRVAAELRREVATLVHDAVRDRLIPSVSVSDVEVTRDLAYANVFVTALDPDTATATVKELNDAARDFRRELSHRLRMRSVPEIRFKYDDSVDRGERIEGLLSGRLEPEDPAL